LTNNKAIEKIKSIYRHFKAKLRLRVLKFPHPKAAMPQASLKTSFENPQSLAYQLIGEKTEHVIPLFRDMDSNLQKSGLKINFQAYVSLTVFSSFMCSLGALLIVPVLAYFVFGVAFFPAILFGVGASLFAGAFTVVAFYFYPIYRADAFKRDLEDELPFTTGYMAILTSAGVFPESIFQSLSTLSMPLAVSQEAKNVMRDVNLFGLDIISALTESSKRTPSERFRELLEGFISTVHSGGNLPAYLREKSRQYMKLKRISLKKYSDTLSILSEFYVALLVTGPLLLVIMLAVMSMLGGGGLGILSPDLILNLVTYLGIPLGSLVFIIILDAISPKW
jgi:flagellar protein FlaJ